MSIARPAIALKTPTVICGSTTSAPTNYDDNVFNLTVPFPLTIYGVQGTAVEIGVNGVCQKQQHVLQDASDGHLQIIGIGPVTTQYTNAVMPSYTNDATGLFPCWDDLYVYQGLPQGLFYQVTGTSPNQAITFEWLTSHYQNSTFYYHFLVSFYQNMANVTTVDHLNMSDSGNSATMGIEAQTRKLCPFHVALAYIADCSERTCTPSTPLTRRF